MRQEFIVDDGTEESNKIFEEHLKNGKIQAFSYMPVNEKYHVPFLFVYIVNIIEERKKNEGTFEVWFKESIVATKFELNDFFIKDGFVVFEYKDGNVEHCPESRVIYVGIRKVIPND